MRIRQEAHIEYQIGVVGHSVLESKADARDQNGLIARAFLKLLDNVRTKLVDVELRCIDNYVSQVAQEIELRPLCAYCIRYRRCLAERMRPARLAKPAH